MDDQDVCRSIGVKIDDEVIRNTVFADMRFGCPLLLHGRYITERGQAGYQSVKERYLACCVVISRS